MSIKSSGCWVAALHRSTLADRHCTVLLGSDACLVYSSAAAEDEFIGNAGCSLPQAAVSTLLST